MTTANWKTSAELIGMATIVASLIFVGLQLRQEQAIAIVDTYGSIVESSQGVLDLVLGADDLEYCRGDTARTNLITTYSWSIFGDTYDCSSLPVELISFSAKLMHDQEVLLEWHTASEIENRGFGI